METTLIQPRNLIISVDDDEEDVYLLKLLFRKAGVTHPMEIYRCGDDLVAALSALLRKSVKRAMIPLLCFLDIKMPEASGHDILQWIRQHPQLDPISVVMLSSSEHPDDVKRAAEGGAQCYLAKYPQPAVLRSVVDEAERLASGDVSKQWFGLSANLLLRWGLHKE